MILTLSTLFLILYVPINCKPIDVHELHELSVGGSIAAPKWFEWSEKGLRSALLEIFHRIDADQNDTLTHEELEKWIKHVNTFGTRRKTIHTWYHLGKQEDELLSWDEYFNNTYDQNDDQIENLQTLIIQDRRRWKVADMNHDRKLSLHEFSIFLHPQLYHQMRRVLSLEMLESMDEDDDGQISEEEYLSAIAKSRRRTMDSNEAYKTWVAHERDQFRRYWDQDKNGTLDQHEIGEWLFPKDYDEIDAEVRYLMLHLDDDRDNLLTLSEVMNDLFVFLQSQVTNFGRALEYYHEI